MEKGAHADATKSAGKDQHLKKFVLTPQTQDTETYLIFPAAMVFAHRSQAFQFVFPGDPDWDISQRTVNSANIVIKKGSCFILKDEK